MFLPLDHLKNVKTEIYAKDWNFNSQFLLLPPGGILGYNGEGQLGLLKVWIKDKNQAMMQSIKLNKINNVFEWKAWVFN